MASDHLTNSSRRTWWALVLRGALALGLGVFVLTRPVASLAVFALVIALWALFAGITGAIHAIELRHTQPHMWLRLLGGIAGAIFGIVALYDYPLVSLAFVVIWVAWWLLITGLIEFAAALQERRANLPWGWSALWGVACIVAGGLALAHPPGTLAVVMLLIAVFAVITGLMLIAAGVRLRWSPLAPGVVRTASI
jgi:uncharacterized membrane protein HdeD (DUF308 family)